MDKILVVDDEERILRLYSIILMKAGFEVVTAAGAKNGLALAISSQPSLILLDVMMPAVDGTEALATLSANPATKHIPVIFLTSLIQEKEVDDAQGEIGGHEFISKSTPIDKFVAKIKKALSTSRPSAPMAVTDQS